MPNIRFVHAWFLASVASAMVGAVALSGSAQAQAVAVAVRDPGVRGGAPGAGGPLPDLVAGGAGFFAASTVAAGPTLVVMLAYPSNSDVNAAAKAGKASIAAHRRVHRRKLGIGYHNA